LPENIPKRTLLVVSDTPARRVAGSIEVYEPVLREMKMLLTLFDEIVWLTSDAGKRKYALATVNDVRIKVVVMPSVYHSRFNWLFSIANYPVLLYYILKYRRYSNYVHTRGPSHPALLTILLSGIDSGRQYWHKYAGNWEGGQLPFMYRLQKRLLKREKENTIVTVNGNDSRLTQILNFENPCFTKEELNAALQIAHRKTFDKELSILYVGNLYHAKGVLNLLDALKYETPIGCITKCFIVGDGPLYDEVKRAAQHSPHIEIIVTGALTREALNKYYEASHFLILPSISEGFPKVIAEAAAYGCIPIVTGLSVIPNYIKTGINGYLLDDNNAASIQKALRTVFSYDLQAMSRSITNITSKFTYEYYISRIKQEVYKMNS
jgi:glycosyltransferase involved in cell wall biosynthesis